MNVTKGKKPRKILTHNGNFHTDDVFACAALSLLYDNEVEVVRSRDPKILETANYVVDVGGVYNAKSGRFDHHQEGGAGVREENKIPYSSFGLIWKEFGEKISGGTNIARRVDEKLVQTIDAGDNGIETFTVQNNTAPYTLQNIISLFRPSWQEKRKEDEGFLEALELAKKILVREIIYARDEESGVQFVKEAYQKATDKRIIILNDNYSGQDVLTAYAEPLFVVKPDRGSNNMWKVEAVRSDPHTFQCRKRFPIAWAGKRDKEFVEVSGVSDAVFCHNQRFVAIAGSKEGALALVRIAVADVE